MVSRNRKPNRYGRDHLSGLQIPGRVELSIELAEAPLASPACLTLNTPSGPHVKIVGGLSKVEHVAALVGAGMLAALTNTGMPIDGLAVAAVDAAESILAECARRRQPAPVNGQPQS